MPLFEDDPNKEFVEEVLMSWLQYEKFLIMMCEAAKSFQKYSRK